MSTSQLAFNYFVDSPKNFFYGVSTCAYWGCFSPKSRRVAEKVVALADGFYDACLWPSLGKAMEEFYRKRTFVNFAGLVSYGAGAAEFLHTHNFISLSKKIPYIQAVGNVCDVVWYGAELHQRCSQVSKYQIVKVALAGIIQDVIAIAEAVFLLLALAYGGGYALSFTVNLLLDTAYLGLDCYIHVLSHSS